MDRGTPYTNFSGSFISATICVGNKVHIHIHIVNENTVSAKKGSKEQESRQSKSCLKESPKLSKGSTDGVSRKQLLSHPQDFLDWPALCGNRFKRSQLVRWVQQTENILQKDQEISINFLQQNQYDVVVTASSQNKIISAWTWTYSRPTARRETKMGT